MTGTNKIAAPRMRLTSLDAVRGIASFIVILSHCYLIWPEGLRSRFEAHPLWAIPLSLFHNGDGAVMIFFVLSGYVLALPFFRETQPSYSRYVLKRLCRIYIPFAITILIAACLCGFISRRQVPDASVWFNEFWPSRWPGLSVLAGHLVMTGTERDMQLDVSMWSLVYELRISLIFPLLVMLCRNTARAVFVVLLMLVISKILLGSGQTWHPARAPNFWTTLVLTVKIAPSFVFGILLSKHRDDIRGLLRRLPRRMRAASLAPAIIIFSINNEYLHGKENALYSLGAALLIVLALEGPGVGAFLDRAIPQWLGRISYSLYLIHLPIMLVLFPMMLGRVPFMVAVLVVIPITLAAATVMHILVEAPAIKLGHRLARPGAVSLSG